MTELQDSKLADEKLPPEEGTSSGIALPAAASGDAPPPSNEGSACPPEELLVSGAPAAQRGDTTASESPSPIIPPIPASQATGPEEKSGSRPPAGSGSNRVSRKLTEASSREAQLASITLNKTKEVLIPWDGLEKFAEELISGPARIVLVGGRKNSGRFTTGLWLGLATLKDKNSPRIVAPTRTSFSGHELDLWIKEEHRQQCTAYILREPLASGLAIEWLTDERLETINRRLRRELDSWLIFTVAPEELGALSGKPGVACLGIPDFAPPLLAETFKRLANWLDKNQPAWDLGPQKEEILEACRSIIGAKLKTPPEIDRLLARLPLLLNQKPSDGAGSLTERVNELADDVTGGLTQVWFAGLSPNAQLLALLVEAFRGIPRIDVENIYCDEARRLHGETGLLQDPRAFSFDDMYRQLDVQVVVEWVEVGEDQDVELQRLRFVDIRYRHEIWRQMRSRHHLLWGVVESARERWLPAVNDAWQAAQRQDLGLIVARLGIHRPHDLEKLLSELAQNPSGITASVPGYILRGVCLLEVPDYSFVIRILGAWIGKPDHVWAALAAIWRVYVEVSHAGTVGAPGGRRLDEARILQRLEAMVTTVAGSLDLDPFPEDEDFIGFAIERMFLARPAEIGRMIDGWLRKEGNAAKAGKRAIQRLFWTWYDTNRLPDNCFGALLELVGPVLRLEWSVADEVLRTLLAWTVPAERRETRIGGDTGRKQSEIFRSLLKVCNRVHERDRSKLRRALAASWLRAQNPEAREMACAILARMRLIDGVPTELPGAGYAALLMDASAAGRRNETADRLTHELFEFIRPQVDLWAGQLGNSRELSRPGERLRIEELPSRPSTPRILMPWIERFRFGGGETRQDLKPYFVFVLQWGELVDIEDATGTDVPILPLLVKGHYLDERKSGELTPLFGAMHLLLPYLGVPLSPEHLWRISREENVDRSELILTLAERSISPCLSRVLADRSEVTWRELLGARWNQMSGAAPDWENQACMMSMGLETLAAELDNLPVDANKPDPLRMGLGLVQLIAASDLSEAVRLLCNWMRLEDGNVRANFAQAAAIMLIQIRFASMLATPIDRHRPAPPTAIFAPLLKLGPALVRRESVLGMRALFAALRLWVSDSAWASLLRNERALVEMVDRASDVLCEKMQESLSVWTSQTIADLEEAQVPEAVYGLRLRLECALATRPGLTDILKNTILILIDSSAKDAKDARLRKIAYGLYSLAENEPRRETPPLRFTLFQSGHRQPIAVSGETIAVEDFGLRPDGIGTFGPALDYLAPNANLIMILADRQPVDADDWLALDGPLHKWIKEGRLLLYWDSRQIPAPSVTPAWTPLYQAGNVDDALNLVLGSLRNHLARLNLKRT